MRQLNRSVRKIVVGPKGTLAINYEDDGQTEPGWSVRITGGDLRDQMPASLTGDVLIGILPSAPKAMARARKAAGLSPKKYVSSRPAVRLIDRRGLVAHSKAKA